MALETLGAYGLVHRGSISVSDRGNGEGRETFKPVPYVMPSTTALCKMLHSNTVQDYTQYKTAYLGSRHLYDRGNCPYHVVAVVSIMNHQKITSKGSILQKISM